MPFAMMPTATLGGIIEERNGSPFRLIQLQGTTGVTPFREQGTAVHTFNFAEAAFAGTINNAAATAAKTATTTQSMRNNYANNRKSAQTQKSDCFVACVFVCRIPQ